MANNYDDLNQIILDDLRQKEQERLVDDLQTGETQYTAVKNPILEIPITD